MGQSQVLTLTKGRVALDFRIAALVFGLCALPVGLFATFQTLQATVDILLGRPFEGYYWLGPLFSIAFTGLGAAFLWSFFMPGETLEFDPETKTLTSTRLYAFKRTRVENFPLAALKPPEVVWVRDADARENGYWVVRIEIPPRRIFDHKPHAHSAARQKDATEILRDNILALS